MAFDAATGGYTTLVSIVNPKRNLRLDPDIRAPRHRRLSIGLDREVGGRVSVAAAYVRKQGGQFIGWTDVGGSYREDIRFLPNSQSVPVFVLVNSTANRRFLLTNPAEYTLTYNGLVLRRGKTTCQWVARVRLVHLLAHVGLQRAVSRPQACRSAPSPAILT